MPAAVTSKVKESDLIWKALRAHIIKEREKKKQEQEADAEEERQRNEREHEQKRNVLTLGETREEIQKLEVRLATLKEEREQLLTQLKKLYSTEDDHRQLLKRENEKFAMQNYVPQSQVFLQPSSGRAALLYKIPQNQHNLLQTSSLKRSRSPSPPPLSQQSYPVYQNYNKPIYSHAQKLQEPRRNEYSDRAVLWNKNASTSGYYAPSTTSSHGPMIYSYAPTSTDKPQPHIYTRDDHKSHQPAVIYTHSSQPANRQQVTYVGVHPNAERKEVYVVPQTTNRNTASHIEIHGGSIPIQHVPQGIKTGGITSGYPVRSQSNFQTSIPSPHSSSPVRIPLSQSPRPSASPRPMSGQIPVLIPARQHIPTSLPQQQQRTGHIQSPGPPPRSLSGGLVPPPPVIVGHHPSSSPRPSATMGLPPRPASSPRPLTVSISGMQPTRYMPPGFPRES